MENDAYVRILAQIADNAPASITVHDFSGTFLYANEATFRLHGYTREEFLKKNLREIDAPQSAERIAERMEQIKREGEAEFEVNHIRKDGSEVPLHVLVKVVKWGETDVLLSIATDISERKKAEDALREREELLNATQQLSKVGGWVWDVPAQTMSWTREAYRIHDIDPGEIPPGSSAHITRSLACYGETDRERIRESFRRCADEGIPYDLEVPFTSVAGRRLWVRTFGRPVFQDGRVVRVVGIIMDITDRKQGEEALRQSEERYRLIAENTADYIWTFDLDLNLTYISPAVRKIRGYSAEEAMAQTLDQVLTPESLGKASAFFREELAREAAGDADPGRKRVFETEEYRRDGSTVFIENTVTFLRDSSGAPTGILGISRDITYRKRSEEALRELNRYNRSLIEANIDPLVTIDPGGRIRDVNAAVEGVTGVARQEMIGTEFSSYFTEPEKAQEGYLRVFSEGHVIDYPLAIRHRNGRVTPVLYNASVYRDREGNVRGVLAAARDISRLKEVEQALRESEQFLVKSQEMGHMGDWVWDVAGNTLRWSEELYRIFGVPTGFRLTYENIEALVCPDDREQNSQVISGLFSGDDTAESELRIIRPDGEVRHLFQKAEVTRDLKGSPVQIFGVIQDITERKQSDADRESLMREISAKNAELERFTYTVSHDLKSPLITIRGFLGFLEEDAASGDLSRLREDISRIDRATEKIQQLIDALLELSRIGRIANPREWVSLSAIAREAADLLEGPIQARGVVVSIAPDLPEVYADRPRLREVFTNLIENAVKFMGDQPEPCIRIETRGESEGYPVVCIRDNGIGIDPANRERIFALFSKLDPSTPGSGIGLSLVRRIIEVHGGRIWLESEGTGRGSTFCFTFPERSSTGSPGPGEDLKY